MTHQNPFSTEVIEQRLHEALNLLVAVESERNIAISESARWKQRHADLTISTMWIVGVLLLVIAGLVWTCMLLMSEGCR